jgi:hypothetical protein
MSERKNTLVNVYNLTELTLWSLVFVMIIFVQFDNSFKYFLIILLRVAQTLQLTDIILNFLKFTKGSVLLSLMQISGRVTVTWLCIDTNTHNSILLNIIAWALSEIIRYTYYIYPTKITSLLR